MPCLGRDERTSKGMRKCGLGTGTGMVRMGGELVAYSFKQKKTGYKAPNAYGAKPTFPTDTTNRHFQNSIKVVGETMNKDKKLMPYSHNAPRNRPKETMENTVGKRYGTPASCKTETYKGMSHFYLKDRHPESNKPWKTTNQVFSECAGIQNTVGLVNPGIASDMAKTCHKKQGIYTK